MKKSSETSKPQSTDAQRRSRERRPSSRKLAISLAAPFLLVAIVLLPAALISRPSVISAEVDATALSFAMDGADRQELLRGVSVREVGFQNYGSIPLGASQLQREQKNGTSPAFEDLAGAKNVLLAPYHGAVWVGGGEPTPDSSVTVHWLRLSPKTHARFMTVTDDPTAITLDVDDAQADGEFATGKRVPLACSQCEPSAGQDGDARAYLTNDTFGHIGPFLPSPLGLLLSLQFGKPEAELIDRPISVSDLDFSGMSQNRRQSTIHAATITFEDMDKTVNLRSGDVLVLSGTKTGLVMTSLTLDNGKLHAVLYGTADSLRTGRAKFTASRLPSYLEWWASRAPLLLYSSAVLYIGGLLLAIARVLGFIPGKKGD